MAYILPQVVINQLFSEVPLNTIQNQNVLVFGPNYQCYRYGDDSVKASLLLGTHDGQSIKVSGASVEKFNYPVHASGAQVDAGSVKIYAENALVELTWLDDWTALDDGESGMDFDGRIKFYQAVAGADRNETKFPRSIVPGDRISIAYKDGDEDKTFESIILEVFATDKDEFPDVLDGIRFEDTLPDALRGQDFHDPSGETGAGAPKVSFVADLDGVELPAKGSAGVQWSADSEGISIKANGNLQVVYADWSDTPVDISSADVYVEYRELLTDAADTLHTIRRTTDVETELGEATPDNPLALGVEKALQNSGDRVVYYMATRGTTKADFNEVLRAAGKTNKVYALVPLTRDSEIIKAVVSHIEEMSTGSKKRWRIAFVATDVPEENVMLTKAASTTGDGYFARVSAATAGAKAGKACVVTIVETKGSTDPNTTTKCATTVKAGDMLRIYSAAGTDYSEYKIARAASNTVLELDTTGALPEVTPNGPASRIEIVHNLTHAEQASAIAAASRYFMNRRVYNVFPNFAKSGEYTVGGEILAAAAAGVMSSVLPQQPITNVELIGIDDVPLVYEGFSRDELDEIAEGGTFIIMQDLPGDRVYIRHQLSTEYGSNNLLKAELSITKNLDSIAYYYAELFEPYVGKYNITPDLLELLSVEAEGGLAELKSSTSAGLIGPQVLPEGTEIVSIKQSETNQDHVNMHLRLNLPRPFNVLDLNLEVI